MERRPARWTGWPSWTSRSMGRGAPQVVSLGWEYDKVVNPQFIRCDGPTSISSWPMNSPPTLRRSPAPALVSWSRGTAAGYLRWNEDRPSDLTLRTWGCRRGWSILGWTVRPRYECDDWSVHRLQSTSRLTLRPDPLDWRPTS